jgi:phosphopantothenoylcysteine synthetase/decarboxylase
VEINARLWVLNLSDGENSLLDIAERSGLSFTLVHDAAELLFQSGLLSVVQAESKQEMDRRDLLHEENLRRP